MNKVPLLILIFACWSVIVVIGKRVPGEHPWSDAPDNKIQVGSIPDTCPDECIYIAACGKGTTVELDSKDASYVAEGDGWCTAIGGLDKEKCPLRSMGDCMLKCGGDICASGVEPLRNEFFHAYQKLNNPNVNIYDGVWYEKYFKEKFNTNGAESKS